MSLFDPGLTWEDRTPLSYLGGTNASKRVILSTSFIDKHVHRTEYSQRQVTLRKVREASIITSFWKEFMATTDLENIKRPDKSVCRAEMMNPLSSFAETSVLVSTSVEEIYVLDTCWTDRVTTTVYCRGHSWSCLRPFIFITFAFMSN